MPNKLKIITKVAVYVGKKSSALLVSSHAINLASVRLEDKLSAITDKQIKITVFSQNEAHLNAREVSLYSC